MRSTFLLALLAAVLLSACELRLAGDVRVGPDGDGTLELLIALDAELHELLLDAGVDPLRGIDEVSRAAPAWTVDQVPGDDGGLSVSLSADFDDPDEFASLVDGLHASLDADDGALWDGLRLEVTDGSVRFVGRAGLVVPRFPGADGDVEFDEDDLARLVRERGSEFVRYDLRVTMPGEVVAHDADELDGSTVVWNLPVGELRDVSVTSELATAGTPLMLTAVALLVAAGTAVTVVAVRTRRASKQRREARTAITTG